MKNKASLVIAGSILVILILILILIRFSSPEDTWICDNEQWVRHGNPDTAQPIDGCGLPKQEQPQEQPKQEVPPIVETFDYKDLVKLESPLPNDTISSPLIIRGQARGTWFFEASFPISVVNWDGLIIGEGIAQAQSDWMTEEFVPFTATITFDTPTYKNNGALILQKDNPSGLPAHDDALEIPILFEGAPIN